MLGDDGPFAAYLDGFDARPEQQQMAAAIDAALNEPGVLVCEAGTGTGKTLAYLVPALAAGKKTIISTATKTLQDQLFARDIPLSLKALAVNRRVALLKGRQNYLCHYRLERARSDAGLDHRHLPALDYLQRWAARSSDGDLEHVEVLAVDPALRGRVTSTADNCLGQECPDFERCFVLKARRAAAAAEIVVVNHHLLFADLALREGGFGELLPTAEVVVLDEAHKVPDIATQFFSRQVSAAQIRGWCRDALDAAVAEAPDTPAFASLVTELERALAPLFGAVFERVASGARRVNWQVMREQTDTAAASANIAAQLGDVVDALRDLVERGPALESCFGRLLNLHGAWQLFLDEADEGHVQWIERSDRNVTLYDTPVNIGREFSARLAESEACWVLTSATLAVGERFDHFTQLLGVEHAATWQWESPFDFASNALLYVPPIEVEPRHPDYERQLTAAVLPVLEASEGRAFFLFTSYRALNRVAELLGTGCRFPLLVQGDAPRGELLRRFRDTPAAVLLGTATFWEGVDVRGEQLSCVIIDKLPFAVPDDPVQIARGELIAAAGGNPFADLQLPQAVMSLKQGAGRLIRDRHDRGVLVIGDNRIVKRPYGSVFRKSLPPMPLTTDVADVEVFFRAAPAGPDAGN